MLCQGCSKTLRSSDGIKCNKCESRYHIKCVEDTKDCHLDSGDRKYHWTCATCKRPTSKSNINTDYQILLNAINVVAEKLELVNKIQLPKLNNDLMQIKLMADRIFKQNENILQKIDEMKTKNFERRNRSTLRRRNLNISPRTPRPKGDGEQTPILGDKFTRYRTRRRIPPLINVLLQLNRRLHRTRTPRK